MTSSRPTTPSRPIRLPNWPALSTSNAQTLAIDVSPLIAARGELRRAESLRVSAERDEAEATRRRRNLEARASRWRPKTRRELDDARATETAASRRTAQARLQEKATADRVRRVEDDHIAVPTRTLQSRLERSRDLGRGLER